MAKRKPHKNPYVYPDEGRHMHNQVGNDGYSFDEPWDRSDYEEEARREGRELPPLPGDKDVGDGGMSL